MARKLEDENFIRILREYDVLCLSECWVKCPNNFDLSGYEKKHVFREKCNGGGVVLFYKKCLSQYIEIIKECADSMIWFKFDKSLMLNNQDLYMCTVYIPPDRNMYYRKYNCDVFDILQEQIEHFSSQGTVSIIGDLNGRVEIEKDYIVSDVLDKHLLDDIQFLGYESDDILCDRLSEDLKSPNSFGCRILELCKSSSLRICNGRFGQDSSKITFSNKNGSSIIDYLLMSHDCLYNCIKNFKVCDFNTYSCHAPLHVEIYTSVNPLINIQCNCKSFDYKFYKWDEGSNDDVVNDLMVNTQKFEDLLISMTERDDNIDESVETLNKLLTEIFDKYSKCESKFTEVCDKCEQSPKKRRLKVEDKPWFSEDCKELYRNYQKSLEVFNKTRSDENRLKLNLAKQKYKVTENKLKRLYKNQQRNMLNNLRRNNPKKFYRKFKRIKKRIYSDLTIEQFEEHFKKLMNKENINGTDNGEVNLENVFKELDVPFTDIEIEKQVNSLKKNKSVGVDNIMNEYFLAGKTVLIPVLCKLFNNILSSGNFPELWVRCIIIPIFKKGDVNDAGNYRGISLVSHVGKLFTSLINSRLLKWSEENNVLTDAQFGFRPGLGTTDAIFALHSLISKTLSKGNRLYCCFIDYIKAFDSVSRVKLWLKLARIGITGKILNVIKSMYSKLKAGVKLNGNLSDIFSCNVK